MLLKVCGLNCNTLLSLPIIIMLFSFDLWLVFKTIAYSHCWMNPWTSDNIVIFCLLAVNRFLLCVSSAKCGNRYTADWLSVCLSVCHVWYHLNKDTYDHHSAVVQVLGIVVEIQIRRASSPASQFYTGTLILEFGKLGKTNTLAAGKQLAFMLLAVLAARTTR